MYVIDDKYSRNQVFWGISIHQTRSEGDGVKNSDGSKFIVVELSSLVE